MLAGAVAATFLAVVVTVAVVGAPSSDEDGTPSESEVVQLRASPGELRAVATATTASLRAYWTTTLEEVYGKRFRDLAGGFQAKTPRSRPWTCGGRRLTYDDIKGNAFYCGGRGDDYIAYDMATLFPRLNKAFGALAPAVVLAHEMGHAIQARAAVEAPSAVIELQADCFAGAWVAHAGASSADAIAYSERALDRSVWAILTLRDQPGTAATNPRAHGLAFDRVNAFQTGFQQGAKRCSTFPEGDVVITELPFRTLDELRTGGNIGIVEALPFFIGHLDEFWAAALRELSAGATYERPLRRPVQRPPLASCPGDTGYDRLAVTAYCTPSHTVSWAMAPLAQVHQRVGDMATGAALSLSWARAAQAQTGLETSGRAADLQQVCFTGAWVSSIVSDARSPVDLSPGDVDEVLLTTLTPLSPDQADEVESTAFERTDALRLGLLEGLASCTR
jgi:predicted metalloprotease